MAMYRSHVLICGGTGCVSNGATEVTEAMRRELARRISPAKSLWCPRGATECADGADHGGLPRGDFLQPGDRRGYPRNSGGAYLQGRPERLMYSGGEEMPTVPHYKDIPFYGKQHRSP
ncbi:hypothetical protein MASR1M66_10720 [Aminivibrio sp.]